MVINVSNMHCDIDRKLSSLVFLIIYSATICLSIPQLRYIGFIITILSEILIVLGIISKLFYSWKIRDFEIPMILLFFWYLFLSFIHFDILGLYQTFQLLFVFFVFMFCVRYGLNYPDKKILFVNVFLIISIVVYILIANKFKLFQMFQTSQQGFYLNPNITGAIGFLVMINSVLASTKNRRGLFRIIFIFGLLVIILSKSRSIYLSIISYAFTYLLYNNFKNIKKRRFFYFLLIILMVSFVYLYSSQSVLLYRIDNIISHYSGKNFYSGRQQFWGNLLEEILRKPILGYGTSTTPFNLLDVSLSSHNLYLQVGIQAGIVGIGLLILFFYKLFFYFCESSTREGRIGAAILVSTMIHQIFEVSLTQNNLGLGLLVWIPLGVLCSRISINKSRKIK